MPAGSTAGLQPSKKGLRFASRPDYAALTGYGQFGNCKPGKIVARSQRLAEMAFFFVHRFQRRHAQGLREGCRFHYLGLANPARVATINASDGGGQPDLLIVDTAMTSKIDPSAVAAVPSSSVVPSSADSASTDPLVPSRLTFMCGHRVSEFVHNHSQQDVLDLAVQP